MAFDNILAGSAFVLVIAVSSGEAQALKLPKEVTPAIRAACEKDVRRLCVRKGSTIATVKRCVVANFAKLNARCKMRLVARFGVRAGF